SGGAGPCTYVLRTGTHSGEVCGLPHTTQRCFGRLTDAWRTQFPDAVELPRWHDLLLQNVPIFDLDFNAILAAMYALADITEGDCYLRVPPDPGTVAAALGASASAAPGTSAAAALGASASAALGADTSPLSGTAPTASFHTFTLDSGASRSFFGDSTTLTPLTRPVAISLADPSGGPVLAHSSTILPCPAAPSGLLSGLHLPSFSTNLVKHLRSWPVGPTNCFCCRSICRAPRGARRVIFFPPRAPSAWRLFLPATRSGRVAVSSIVTPPPPRRGPPSRPCPVARRRPVATLSQPRQTVAGATRGFVAVPPGARAVPPSHYGGPHVGPSCLRRAPPPTPIPLYPVLGFGGGGLGGGRLWGCRLCAPSPPPPPPLSPTAAALAEGACFALPLVLITPHFGYGGSSLYTLTTAPPPVSASGQVAASSQVFAAASRSSPASAPFSCCPLAQETLLWHHRLGLPSLPRLRARIRGQGHERYFLVVVDDYSRYTTVFPLRSKGEVTKVLIDWIRGSRRQLGESFSSDLPVLRLHSDRGGEFSSAFLTAFCRSEGIRHTFTLPASPQQNGIAERRSTLRIISTFSLVSP
ncbi:unnamed protein product, partial [Closterium sp. NIES-53]